MRKYECVLQDGAKDCGVSSLLTIIKYYGGSLPKEYLRNVTNTTNDGVNALSLVEAGRKIGFDAKGVSGDVLELHNSFLPCIAHVVLDNKYKHFVVVFEINRKKNYMVIGDSRCGVIKMSIDRFKKISTNTVIILKLIKELPTIKTSDSLKRSLVITFANNIKEISLICINSGLYTFLNIIVSFTFEFIIDKSLTQSSIDNLYILGAVISILYCLKNISLFYRNKLINYISHKFDYILINSSFSHILSLPYLYYKNRTTGEVISRFKDLNTIRSFINRFFCIISTDLISIIIFFIIMFRYQKHLTIYTIIPLSILLLYQILISPKKKKHIKSISHREDMINSYLIQGISNVDTIKGSHLEKRLIDKFMLNYKSFLEAIYSYNILLERYSFNKNNLNDISLLIIFGLGSYYVINGNLPLNNLIIYQLFF